MWEELRNLTQRLGQDFESRKDLCVASTHWIVQIVTYCNTLHEQLSNYLSFFASTNKRIDNATHLLRSCGWLEMADHVREYSLLAATRQIW